MSIVEVAKEAGVSHATVSYVLNGKDGVSSATAQRVQLAMRKLNYIPRSHMTKTGPNQYNLLNGLTHGCIGVVFYGKHSNLVSCPFHARLVHSIEEELRERNISMMLIRLSELTLLTEYKDNEALINVNFRTFLKCKDR